MSVYDASVESTDMQFVESPVTRLTIVYKMTLYGNTFEHRYCFYIDGCSEGERAAWSDFMIVLIDGREDWESLIFHVKRNGAVMSEFVAMCVRRDDTAVAA